MGARGVRSQAGLVRGPPLFRMLKEADGLQKTGRGGRRPGSGMGEWSRGNFQEGDRVLGVMKDIPAPRHAHRPSPFVGVSRRRLVAGALLGLAFAATFHLAFVSFAYASRPVFESGPVGYASRWEDPWNRARLEKLGRPVPEIVGPVDATAPAWMEPFWAGLSAALGQCVGLATWLMGPALLDRRQRRGRRHACAQILMGVGLAPLVFVKLGELYVAMPYSGAIWASAFGDPPVPDPFAPFGLAALLVVVVLALDPWRALQARHRCGWGPALGLAAVAVATGLLFAVGRWALAGMA